MAKRRHRRGEKGRLEALKHQLQADGVLKGHEVIFRTHDKEKLSAAILKLIEPHRELAPTYAAYNLLIALAIVAWNAALVEGEERQNMLDRLLGVALKTENEKTRAEVRQFMNELIKRKERYFPEDKRYVVGYHLSETKENYHLSVASLQGE